MTPSRHQGPDMAGEPRHRSFLTDTPDGGRTGRWTAAAKRTFSVMGSATEIRSEPARARIPALLAVLVIALAGVVSRPAHAAAQADVTVKNYSFTPADLEIDVGTEVVWTATQGDHTVTSDGGSFDGLIAQDYEPHSFSYTFTKPGRYTYYCGFHRAKGKGMAGVVQVRDPSGGPTTTEPPTTTTTWSPPTSTTTAPATTTTAPPVTATTSAPTVTTAPALIAGGTVSRPVRPVRPVAGAGRAWCGGRGTSRGRHR